MTTIVNTPSNNDSNGFSIVFGAILVIIGLVLVFVYVIPRMQNKQQDATPKSLELNLTVPEKAVEQPAQ